MALVLVGWRRLIYLKGVYWTLGWAAYLTPVALFTVEYISLSVKIGEFSLAKRNKAMSGLLIFVSVLFDMILANKTKVKLEWWAWWNGGQGHWQRCIDCFG